MKRSAKYIYTILITASLITVFVILQLKWAHDHNYYKDIVLRIILATAGGSIIGALYIWAIYDGFHKIRTFINRFFKFRSSRAYQRFLEMGTSERLRRTAIIHFPLYLLWLYPFHLELKYFGPVNAWLKILIPVLIFILLFFQYYVMSIERLNGFFRLKELTFEMSPLSVKCALMGSVFVMLIFFTLFLSVIVFAMGSSLGGWIFPLSVVLSAAFLFWGVRAFQLERKGKTFITLLLIFIIAIVAFILIGGFFYNFPFDGQAYHSEMILQIEKGWNPFYHVIRDGDFDYVERHPFQTTILNSMTKGFEIVSAALVSFTGNYESGKAVHFFMILASFFFSLSVFLNFKKISTVISLIIAFIVAFNPVSLSESLSYLVDGEIASTMIIIISLGFLLFLRGDSFFLLLLAASIIYCVNIKFTGLVYVTIITLGILGCYIIFDKNRITLKMLSSVTAGFIFGIILFGYNPYVTNILNHGSPFYPFFGQEGVSSKDMLTKNSNDNTAVSDRNTIESGIVQHPSRNIINTEGELEVNRITPGNISERLKNIFIISFARTDQELMQNATLKLPLTVSKMELHYLKGPNLTYNGGFGPLFSGVIVIAFFLLLLSLPLSVRRTVIVSVILFFLMVSVLITARAHLPRYTPQFWLVPVFILPLGFYIKRRMLRILSNLLLLLLLCNVSLFFVYYYAGQYVATRGFDLKFKELKQSSEPLGIYFYPRFRSAYKARFRDMGIRYTEISAAEKETADLSMNKRIYFFDFYKIYRDELKK